MVQLKDIKEFLMRNDNKNISALSTDDELFLIEETFNFISQFEIPDVKAYKELTHLPLYNRVMGKKSVVTKALRENEEIKVHKDSFILHLYHSLKQRKMNIIFHEIQEIQKKENFKLPLKFVKLFYELSDNELCNLEELLGRFPDEDEEDELDKTFSLNNFSDEYLSHELRSRLLEKLNDLNFVDELINKLYRLGIYKIELFDESVYSREHFSQDEYELIIKAIQIEQKK